MKSESTNGNGGDARLALMRAAEQLFADRGIYAVSLREVNRVAEQRNSMALQYHFTDRDGIIRAILERHGRDVALQRMALLDQWETTGGGLRPLVSALILPLISKMADVDGGAAYLQIAAELLNRTDRIVEPDDPAHPVLHDEMSSVDRWSELVAPLMPSAAVGHPFHLRFVTVRFAHLEVARRARANARGDQRLFTSYLLDLATAIVSTPLSEQTVDLQGARGARR